MTSFTRSDVLAAKNNDLSAITKIMGELLPVIDNIARGIGAKTPHRDCTDDLAAEGRLKLWEMISSHADDDNGAAPIAGQMIRRLKSEMENHATEEMTPGVNYRATQRYLQCLSAANGDRDLAVQLVQELPAGMRLSKALAYEVRSAATMHSSLDETVRAYKRPHTGTQQDQTLADRLGDKGPVTAREEVSGNAIRSAFVHTTLNAMSAKQAGVLRSFYMDEMPMDLIAEESGATLKQVTDTKTVARKNFHARFPFEAVYGSEKPTLVAEHSNAKSVRS